MLPFDIFIPPLVFKSCKALLKNTPSIKKMYKGIEKKGKGRSYRMSSWFKVVKISPCSEPTHL
jgi:hypothetical protein